MLDGLKQMLEIEQKLRDRPKRLPNPYQCSQETEDAGVEIDIEQAAIETLNAVYTARAPEAYEPLFNLTDVAGEPDYIINDWKFVLEVLEEMPDLVLKALCHKRGMRVIQPVT